MKFAVAYNAEYYDKKTWLHDFELMQKAGIDVIRFAEFAWAIMEPKEGEYDFSLIDDIIETAASYGIKSMLCTPTACPPVWLSQNYDILPVNIDGRKSEVGSRQQRCYSSNDYTSHSYKIVEEMAKHFKDNPNVIAWQIDNELCGEMKKCYCPNCRKKFDKYLKNKFKDINELNKRWGTQFWSQKYSSFEEIPTPKHFASDLCLWHNPALNLEFVRFSSDNIIEFSNKQCEILRKYTSVPITTNTDDFRYGDTLDLYKLFENLDISGIDVYSSIPEKIAFYSDFMRSVKPKVNKFWFLEFGDGCANKELLDITERRGSEMMEIYKFRPYPWGQEQSREGVVNIFGNPMPIYSVIKDFDKTVKEVKEKPEVALVYDFQSSWAIHSKSLFLPEDTEDGSSALKYPFYVEKTVYPAIYKHYKGLIQIVSDTFDLSGYKAIVVPNHILYTKELENSLMDFVSNGGTLICDSMLFQKNQDNCYLEKLPKLLEEVFKFKGDKVIDDNFVGDGIKVSYGKGSAVMVKGFLTLPEWEKIIKDNI